MQQKTFYILLIFEQLNYVIILELEQSYYDKLYPFSILKLPKCISIQLERNHSSMGQYKRVNMSSPFWFIKTPLLLSNVRHSNTVRIINQQTRQASHNTRMRINEGKIPIDNRQNHSSYYHIIRGSIKPLNIVV